MRRSGVGRSLSIVTYKSTSSPKGAAKGECTVTKERNALAFGVVVALLAAGAWAQYAETVMENDPGLPWHTVYRPADLSKVDGRLPVVAFGNGSCWAAGNMYEPLLREVASKGYIVIAGGPIIHDLRKHDAEAMRYFPQTRRGHMQGAFEWAIAENDRPGSRFYGKLDTSNMAVMGHSCGGLEALAGGADPRVKTVVVLNSGIIRGGIDTSAGGVRQPVGYLPAEQGDLSKLHTPTIYIAGGPRDFAYRAAEEDFREINRVPLFNANMDTGHSGTWSQPNGGAMAHVVVAWLDWRLKNDSSASRMFVGQDCGLCIDKRWVIKKKNHP